MSRRFLLALVGGLGCVLALSGCAEDGLAASGTLAPVAVASSGAAVAGTVVDSHLQPCPASDTSLPPVAGGLPDITLPCLAPGSGPAQVRLAGLRGHPYAISVWQVACAICREELGTIAGVARAAAGKVEFLGVNVEETERSAVPALFDGAGARYNSVSDADGATRVPLRWATGLPVMLLVRADGTVAHTIIGGVGTATAFRAQLQRSLGVSLP